MNKTIFTFFLAGTAMLTLASQAANSDVTINPQAIAGIPRANNHAATGAYAPSNVQDRKSVV